MKNVKDHTELAIAVMTLAAISVSVFVFFATDAKKGVDLIGPIEINDDLWKSYENPTLFVHPSDQFPLWYISTMIDENGDIIMSTPEWESPPMDFQDYIDSLFMMRDYSWPDTLIFSGNRGEINTDDFVFSNEIDFAYFNDIEWEYFSIK